MTCSNADPCRWWGLLYLLVALLLGAPIGCDQPSSDDDESASSRTARLAVPSHSAAPGLDIWISLAQADDAEQDVDLESLAIPPIGNIAYLPVRSCLGQHEHNWPASHAVTTEFELHNGKIQRGVADYVRVDQRDPKNWPLPDDSLDQDPQFVSCVTKKLSGSIPEKLDLPASALLRVRVGLRPTGK